MTMPVLRAEINRQLRLASFSGHTDRPRAEVDHFNASPISLRCEAIEHPLRVQWSRLWQKSEREGKRREREGNQRGPPPLRQAAIDDRKAKGGSGRRKRSLMKARHGSGQHINVQFRRPTQKACARKPSS